jgi:nicotinate-nucleotide adenylyltransferase
VDGLTRLGIFGGTFDPPHLGHLILAEAARDELGLDAVLWAVAGQSPLKLDRPVSPAGVRVALVQAAIAGNDAFRISRVDLDRPAPHYTVETLQLLAASHPRAELYFLMGEDSLRDLPRWRDPQTILQLTHLAVSQRPGANVDLAALEALVPGLSGRVRWVAAPQVEIASSDIQGRIRAGRSVRYMLPAAVYDIIQAEKLYQA